MEGEAPWPVEGALSTRRVEFGIVDILQRSVVDADAQRHSSKDCYTSPVLCALALLLLLVAAPTAAAPVPSPAAAADGERAADLASSLDADEPMLTFGESADVTWVLVPASVRGPGGFVGDLEADEFRLFVDDRPVPIESVDSSTTAPLALVFLQDLSGSMANAGKLDAGRAALRRLLSHAQDHDRFAVATFAGGTMAVDVPFTADRGVVREALARWQAYGTTSLHDAIAWVPELQLDARSGRAAAVVVTDGVDNASVLSPDTVRSMVEHAEVPVFVLALSGSLLASASAVEAPPRSADAVDDDTARYAEVLRRLAEATNGRYFDIRTRAELRAAGDAVLDALRSQYTLGFLVSGRGPETYHRLRVDVARRGVDVVHRQGYVGAAP